MKLLQKLHSKTIEKIKAVFDCSSNIENLSLNGTLLEVSHMMSNLIGIWFLFRKESVATFHRFNVDKTYRNHVRFCWRNNCNLDDEPTEY